MEYRKIGNTDLKLSAITFGAWAIGGWMWGGADQKDALDAIRTAYDLGVTSIDTAPVYGQGSSEELVGKAIKGIPRDQLQILTKFGMRWDLRKGEYFFQSQDNNGQVTDFYRYAGKESIIKEVEDSLTRLGTDYIDLYQIHWPDSTTPIEETFETVARLIEQGKVRYAGVCNYSTDQMKEAEKYVTLASNQVPYSMVYREIENQVIPYALKHQKSILAYSPLQRGLLTGKMKRGYKFNEGDSRANSTFFSNENIQKVNQFLEQLKPLAQQKHATLAQLVLKWTIEQPGITVALAGARNAAQSAENARTADIPLNHEEVAFINQQLRALRLR